MAEAVGDDLVARCKVVGVVDDFAERVRVFDQAAIGIVVVANGLDASGIGDAKLLYPINWNGWSVR